jgi:membrane-associated phospholipid phosphatase
MKYIFAKIITNLFNPFLLFPLFHIFYFISNYETLNQVIILSLFQTLIPVLTMLFLIRLKKIKDLEMTDVKERTSFFTYLSILFVISCCFVITSPFVLLINLGLALLMLIVTPIYLFWKISAHMIFDVYMFLNLALISIVFLPLILFIPIIAWTRVYLKNHTLNQTIAGSILGSLMFLLVFAIEKLFL